MPPHRGGSLHRTLRGPERRWATKGVHSVAHPSACFCSVRGGSPAPAACAAGSCLPAGLTSAAAGERDRDQDHDGFHLVHLRSLVRGSLRLTCTALRRSLPASLAATTTSEGDRDQDQGEFEHDSPHRLEVRFSLRFARSHERADGDWLEQPACHLQYGSGSFPQDEAQMRVTELRIARCAMGRSGPECRGVLTIPKGAHNSSADNHLG